MQAFSAFPPSSLARLRVVAADVDDTITRAGKIPSEAVACLEALGEARLTVALVTGRPAGWAQALAGYLPAVHTVVAENGLVAFRGDGQRMNLGPEPGRDFPSRLAKNAERVRQAYALTATPDDVFRLFERAFVRPPGFDGATLAASNRLVDQDFEVIASSIHIHVRPAGWDKADGLFAALRPIDPVAVAAPDDLMLFVGDSSNDRPLFARLRRTSVGVRNVRRFLDELGPDQPAFVTEGECAGGFAEVARALLAARRGDSSRALGARPAP